MSSVKLDSWSRRSCVQPVQETPTSRRSQFLGTLNTSPIIGLDMCRVCPEAVDCVAL